MTEPAVKQWYIVTLSDDSEHLWMWDSKNWGVPKYFANSEYLAGIKGLKIKDYKLTSRDNPIQFRVVGGLVAADTS